MATGEVLVTDLGMEERGAYGGAVERKIYVRRQEEEEEEEEREAQEDEEEVVEEEDEDFLEVPEDWLEEEEEEEREVVEDPGDLDRDYLLEAIAEESLNAMIKSNDFYRYVLFKTHYNRYTSLADVYEDVCNKACVLEEEVMALKAELERLEKVVQEEKKSGNKVTNEKKKAERDLEREKKEKNQLEGEVFLLYEKLAKLEDELEKSNSESRDLRTRYQSINIEKRAISGNCQSLKRRKEELLNERVKIERQLQGIQEELKVTRRRSFCQERHLVDTKTQNARLTEEVEILTVNSHQLENRVSEMKHLLHQSRLREALLRAGLIHAVSCERRQCSTCSVLRQQWSKRDKSTKKGLSRHLAKLRRRRTLPSKPLSKKTFSCPDTTTVLKEPPYHLSTLTLAPPHSCVKCQQDSFSLTSMPSAELLHSLQTMNLHETPPVCHLSSTPSKLSPSDHHHSHHSDYDVSESVTITNHGALSDASGSEDSGYDSKALERMDSAGSSSSDGDGWRHLTPIRKAWGRLSQRFKKRHGHETARA